MAKSWIVVPVYFNKSDPSIQAWAEVKKRFPTISRSRVMRVLMEVGLPFLTKELLDKNKRAVKFPPDCPKCKHRFTDKEISL